MVVDDDAAVHLTAPIDRCEVREHRGKRGSKSYTYHLWLASRPTPDRFDVPSQIQVVHELCNAAEARREVELMIKPGRWGLPWYQELSAGGVRWAAPA